MPSAGPPSARPVAELTAAGCPPPIRPGDIFITNDPFRGGSHLPDVTVITPVFDQNGDRVIFFVASRAHHAEIGGVAPGSMPPDSRTLADEGVLIRNLRLRLSTPAAPGGAPHAFDDRALRRILSSGPYPSRAVDENIADIIAQAAANERGAALLLELVRRYGLPTVHAYMHHMRNAAEAKMRAALRRLPEGEHAFTDHLDDGTPIAVRVFVADGAATIDFTGTGPVLPNNLNATPAIVASAVLYCFRCLIGDDLPLNAGALRPLRISLPPGLLNPPAQDDPARCPAVAGGNVETSQRIVDALFGALGVVAASQGTMNNVAFGDATFGYYETIAGGAGAGPDFDGADAVHTHMTNTRLTDVEVLEARYPVRLRRFAIRRGSGGRGRHRGGDGVVREIEFLRELDVSLLTQRRSRPPYGAGGGEPGAARAEPGAGGGEPGARGRNILLRARADAQELGSLTQLRVRPGDVLRIETPGGGGFGPAPAEAPAPG